MSIYSGSSPFSGGKLGGNKLAGARSFGAKLSRGKGKRISRALARRLNSNRETRPATVSAKAFTQVQGGNSSRVKKLLARSMTATSGLGAYDGLGLTSETGGHVYIRVQVGTDYSNADEAVGSLKDLKITMDLTPAATGVTTTHNGFLGTVGTDNLFYIIEFPTITTALVNTDTVSVKLEFTT